MSSCTGTQRNETLTNCVTTPCMDMKTIGIPPCTSTPGQPRNPYGQLHFLQNYSIPVSRLFIHLSNFIAQLKLFFFCDLCRCHFILCHQILVLLVVLLHNFTKHILEIVVTIVFSLFHRIFLLTYDSTSLLSTTFNTTLHFELIYGETL